MTAQGVLLDENNKWAEEGGGRLPSSTAETAFWHPHTIHEQASFSLAVPGPLGGGRVFFITAYISKSYGKNFAPILRQSVSKACQKSDNDMSLPS
jgi:hypothetical protein